MILVCSRSGNLQDPSWWFAGRWGVSRTSEVVGQGEERKEEAERGMNLGGNVESVQGQKTCYGGL